MHVTWSGCRDCATARTPTSRAPVPDRRVQELVGRSRTAERQGPVLPQPVRHRGGLEARQPLRPPGLRHRQARQPVRGRRGDEHHRRLPASPRLRSRERLRRHRGLQPDRDPGPRRGLVDRLHRGRRGARVRSGRPHCAAGQDEPAGAPRAASTLRFDVRPVDGGLFAQEIDPVAGAASMGRRDRAQPTDDQWVDLEFTWQVCAAVSSNAIVLAKELQRSASAPASRTGSTRRGSPPNAQLVAPSEARLRAMPSSRSVTASTPSWRRARRVIEPGGRVRDDEVIAAADEHGVVIVFTGERHFRH